MTNLERSSYGTPLSDRIEIIYSKYYEERALDKANMIEALADEVVNGFSKILNDDFDVYLDFFKIASLVDSYYLDVIRYKEYHFDSEAESDCYSEEWTASVHKRLVSQSKVAALSIKWLLKYKPIQIHPMQTHEPSKKDVQLMLSVNEQLAMMYTFKILNVKSDEVEHSLLKDLEYHMRYRAYDEKHFFIIYKQMMGMDNAKTIHSKEK